MALVPPISGWMYVPEVDLLADLASILVLVGGGVLIFRTFRERYLLWWIFGWASFVIYEVSNDTFAIGPGSLTATAVSQIAFIVAVTLFSGAIFLYLRRIRLLIDFVSRD